MNKDLSQIEFYFPDKDKIKSKQELVRLIVDEMRQYGSTEYSGHLDEESLQESVFRHLGNASIKNYKLINPSQKKAVREKIEETMEKCNRVLPIPTKNYVFVFPWLPEKDSNLFDGTMGFAPYSCVFHIFVDTQNFTEKGIQNTVAHELNHTIYYYHHYNNFGKYNVLDEMIIEGFAENFREQIIDTPAPTWAIALERQEALDVLMSMGSILSSKDPEMIQDVLFGNMTYKRWTGYSVGYWLVKQFIEKNSEFSWEELIKTDSQTILQSAK